MQSADWDASDCGNCGSAETSTGTASGPKFVCQVWKIKLAALGISLQILAGDPGV